MSRIVSRIVSRIMRKNTEPSHALSRTQQAHGNDDPSGRNNGTVRSALRTCTVFLRALMTHLRQEGLVVALAFLAHTLQVRLRKNRRDDGERAAEKYLRTLGYRIIERNWRSPRDRRDEADLIALSPDRSEAVLVEVKRAAGPWDALDRVDGRKKEVLWRLLLDLESLTCATTSTQSMPPAVRLQHPRTVGRGLRRAIADVRSLRVDLIGVRGEGRTASVVRHITSVFERRAKSSRAHAREPT